MKKHNSIWIAGLVLSACSGGRQVSSATEVGIGDPTPRFGVAVTKGMAEPLDGERRSEFRIVDPVVTELHQPEYGLIQYGDPKEKKHHNAASRELEKALTNWLSERPFERDCVAVEEEKYKKKAMEAYTGETIVVIGSEHLALPLVRIGEWVRMTEEQLEKKAKLDCLAIPYLEIIANGTRIVHDGNEYVSAGCISGTSQNGLLEQEYPEGHRSFMAYRDKQGRVHIIRSAWRGMSHTPFDEQKKRRLLTLDKVCERQ